MDSMRLYVFVAVLVSLVESSTAVKTDPCRQILVECIPLIRRHAPGKEFFKCARVAKRCYERYDFVVKEISTNTPARILIARNSKKTVELQTHIRAKRTHLSSSVWLYERY
ncbi:hypothetical protein ScPMuIL_016938 [Solemya velum]